MTDTKQLTWDDVLKRENLIGGDIESVESGVSYRGPTSKIERKGEMIVFTSPWCARLDPETGHWENWSITESAINEMYAPQDIGEGRVFFMDTCPFPTRNTLFPKGGSKLDPARVKGLLKASERLLALYPKLPFDCGVAEQILLEKSFQKQAEDLRKLPDTAKLRDLLAKFRHDSSVEEFLWYYIEAVTGEKNLHQKIY